MTARRENTYRLDWIERLMLYMSGDNPFHVSPPTSPTSIITLYLTLLVTCPLIAGHLSILSKSISDFPLVVRISDLTTTLHLSQCFFTSFPFLLSLVVISPHPSPISDFSSISVIRTYIPQFLIPHITPFYYLISFHFLFYLFFISVNSIFRYITPPT